MLEDFYVRKIQRLRPGLNPQTWVPEASMLTTRPPGLLQDSFILTYPAEQCMCNLVPKGELVMRRSSLVNKVIGVQTGWSSIEFQAGEVIFHFALLSRLICWPPCAPFIGYWGLYFWGKNSQRMNLIIHLNIIMKFRMCRGLPSYSLYMLTGMLISF